MLTKTRAIVLHQVKYGESSILLYCYTAQYGRMTYLVNGVRTKKSKYTAYYFQPLIILDIIFYHKANRNLFRLKELTCPVSYSTIPFDNHKSCVAIFVAEVLYRTLHEEESNPQLFEFFEHAFQTLDKQEEGISNFHLMFLLHYSKFLGIFPAGLLEAETPGGHVDLHMFYNLPDYARKAVVQMLHAQLTQMADIIIDNPTRGLILDQLVNYYNLHLEGILKLKSLLVLKDVFHEYKRKT